MSESESSDEQAPADSSIEFFESLQQGFDYYGAPDRLLQQLVDSANGGGMGTGIPLTLYLHGATIAGYLQSEQDFLRGIADVYREGWTNATADGELPEAADEYAKSVFENRADEADAEIEADSRAFDEHGTKTARWVIARQIQLKDVYYTVPGAASIRHPHARVRMDQVVGWTLGVTTWT
ncbi:hypothetical protein MPRF_26320 [Mycolicibacterium parafortuitum]|uniref:Uncharacterized protein n=1 Tax=Mycolicibacterium parafortuitum TaxID=39692 RepID=A0A7I7U4B7_MYCPF|nr:hypothetical protein [Mycolicibacterium parafortuitum]BBY75733.1 hypothetical protein MPRF_26320 [Mycolicibacterium parafortuitum]